MSVTKRMMVTGLLVSFFITTVMPAGLASEMPLMPKPGAMVALTAPFVPAQLWGMSVSPDDPFRFDFLVKRGDVNLPDVQKQAEYLKLVKYFLAALAVPDTDQWVNLSPYEKDRIIPDNFGLTEMGRDLLAQDYLLKQLAASLIDPDTGLGKKFWDGVYAAAYKRFGTTDVPTDIFHKVWILPDKAVVYEKNNSVYVLESHLKVLTEKDYLAAQNGPAGKPSSQTAAVADIAAQVLKEVILPAVEKEVNEGHSFAPLRQVYSGMLLATWYKRRLKGTALGQLYADHGKVKGVDQDPAVNQTIYAQYVAAFRKGVFNMIREDVDRYAQEVMPRKYFSGGTRNTFDASMTEEQDAAKAEKVIGEGLPATDVVKGQFVDPESQRVPGGAQRAVDGADKIWPDEHLAVFLPLMTQQQLSPAQIRSIVEGTGISSGVVADLSVTEEALTKNLDLNLGEGHGREGFQAVVKAGLPQKHWGLFFEPQMVFHFQEFLSFIEVSKIDLRAITPLELRQKFIEHLGTRDVIRGVVVTEPTVDQQMRTGLAPHGISPEILLERLRQEGISGVVRSDPHLNFRKTGILRVTLSVAPAELDGYAVFAARRMREIATDSRILQPDENVAVYGYRVPNFYLMNSVIGDGAKSLGEACVFYLASGWLRQVEIYSHTTDAEYEYWKDRGERDWHITGHVVKTKFPVVQGAAEGKDKGQRTDTGEDQIRAMAEELVAIAGNQDLSRAERVNKARAIVEGQHDVYVLRRMAHLFWSRRTEAGADLNSNIVNALDDAAKELWWQSYETAMRDVPDQRAGDILARMVKVQQIIPADKKGSWQAEILKIADMLDLYELGKTDRYYWQEKAKFSTGNGEFDHLLSETLRDAVHWRSFHDQERIKELVFFEDRKNTAGTQRLTLDELNTLIPEKGYKAAYLFLGHGSKAQFKDVNAMERALDQTVREFNNKYGFGKWLLVFGGDPADPAKPDIGFLVKRLKEKYPEVPVLAVQADEYQPYGVGSHVDHVFNYPTQKDGHGGVIDGGYNALSGELQGATRYYLGEKFIRSGLSGIVTFGGGPMTRDEVQYGLKNGLKVVSYQLEARFAQDTGKGLGVFDEWLDGQAKLDGVERRSVDAAGTVAENVRGGIDLAQANLEMQIKRDAGDATQALRMQHIENIRIDGLTPKILSIQPAMTSSNMSPATPSSAGPSA